MSTAVSSNQGASGSNPYDNLDKIYQYLVPANNASTSADTVRIYGVGTVPVQVVGDETSPEVQAIWNEQMAIIVDVMDKVNAGTAEPSDLDKLVDALAELEKLATEGVTNENGVTSYLTKGMAQALDLLLYEFSLFGITPDLNTKTMSDQAKINLLTSTKTPEGVDPLEYPLQIAITNAALFKNEDLGFQTYVYTAIMDMINETTGEFEDLETYLTEVSEVINTINDLLELGNCIGLDYSQVWIGGPNMENPGDIPPSAVDPIYDLMVEAGETDLANQFKTAYDTEYAAAVARSETSGKTVQEEMAATTTSPTSADILDNFFDETDYESYETIVNIILDSSVTEPPIIIVPPEGQTIADLGQTIWDIKVALESEILDLEAQGADETLIKTLETIVEDMEKVWTETCGSTTPSSASPAQVEKFVTAYILSIQPGEDGYNNINNGLTSVSNYNAELQKDLEEIMQYLESLVKLLGQFLKIMNDIISSYAKKI